MKALVQGNPTEYCQSTSSFIVKFSDFVQHFVQSWKKKVPSKILGVTHDLVSSHPIQFNPPHSEPCGQGMQGYDFPFLPLR